MRLKLFPKIALILVFLGTLPVILVGWQTATLNREHLESNILELQTNLANSLVNRIDLHLESLAGGIRGLVETLRMQGMISSEPFQAFLDSNEEFVSLAFIDSRGKELLRVGEGVRPIREDPAFKSYLSQSPRSPSFQPKLAFSFENSDPRMSFVFPYNPQRISQGAVYAEVSLGRLWEEITREGAGAGGGGREAFVADQNGLLIAHSDPAKMSEIPKGISVKDNPIVAESLQRKTIGSKEYSSALGQPMIGAYSHVKWTGWVSVIQQPKETAYYAVFETRKRAMQIVVLAMVLAGLAAFVLAKNISRPIFRLIEGARKVTEGDFNQKIELQSKDEMGDLAKTFNEMIRELKRFNDLQVDRIIEEKTKTESVIFSIADGIIMTDRQGTIQLLNEHAVGILSLDEATRSPGMESQAWIGKNLLELLSDTKFKETVLELLSCPDTPMTREAVLVHGTSVQHYQIFSEPVLTLRSQKNLGVVIVLHDVTLERQMDEMKEGFLHSITHDLRNPMTSVQGFIRFLADGSAGPLNDKQIQMLKTMDRASTRLVSMVNDILDIAKIEAGKLQIELQALRLDAVIEDIKSLYQPLADKKSLRLEVVLPSPAESLEIQADANQIERVIGNLVANAVKFTPYEGRITIAAENLPDRIQISVQDTGAGIPEGYREKIFDKFQQVKGERRGGTGLGLTISKHFIELHLGKIWVESESKQGSKFIFWIPKGLLKTEKGEIIVGSAEKV